MHKFDNRINSLIRRTHNFISHADNCLIKDYFHARLEKEEKPADFDAKVAEFRKLDDEYRHSKDPAIRERAREIMESSAALRWGCLIPSAEEHCRKYPLGVWGVKWYTDDIPTLVREAKTYLANRKQRELEK